MAAAALLAKIPSPTDADIDQGMSGNICRHRVWRGVGVTHNMFVIESSALATFHPL